MKKPVKITAAAIFFSLLIGFALIPSSTSGQNANDDDQAIAALIAEVTRQQNEIVANQKQIDEKIALLAEEIRIAKIFVSRGGGKTK